MASKYLDQHGLQYLATLIAQQVNAVKITDITAEYAANDSNATPPTTGWQTTKPEV